MQRKLHLQPVKPATSLNPRPAAVVREVNDDGVLRVVVVRAA